MPDERSLPIPSRFMLMWTMLTSSKSFRCRRSTQVYLSHTIHFILSFLFSPHFEFNSNFNIKNFSSTFIQFEMNFSSLHLHHSIASTYNVNVSIHTRDETTMLVIHSINQSNEQRQIVHMVTGKWKIQINLYSQPQSKSPWQPLAPTEDLRTGEQKNT